MGEGKVPQVDVVRSGRVDDEKECLDGGDEGLVRQHHPFGHSSRPAGVHDDGRVVDPRLDSHRLGGGAQSHHLGETVQADVVCVPAPVSLVDLVLLPNERQKLRYYTYSFYLRLPTNVYNEHFV